MVHHLKKDGRGCFGGWDDSPLAYILSLIVLPLAMAMIRSPMLYWFRPWRAPGDPYDMGTVYKEYKVRATIGQELADKDKNSNGYIDPIESQHQFKSTNKLLGETTPETAARRASAGGSAGCGARPEKTARLRGKRVNAGYLAAPVHG